MDALWILPVGFALVLFLIMFASSGGNLFEMALGFAINISALVIIAVVWLTGYWVYDSFLKGTVFDLIFAFLQIALSVILLAGFLFYLGKMFMMLCRGELQDPDSPASSSPAKVPDSSAKVKTNEYVWGIKDDPADLPPLEPATINWALGWKAFGVFSACLAGAVLLVGTCTLFTW